jgi:polysaccharide export outer membrane protein
MAKCPALLILLALCAVLVFSLPSHAQEYSVGEGDVLKITVFEHPELDSTVRVSSHGAIALPLIGDVEVGGLTAPEISRKLEALLADGYIVDPKVSTFVTELLHNKAVIVGEVSRPGVYEIGVGTSLLELISKAGGLTKEAGGSAIIRRKPSASAEEEVITVDLKRLVEQGDLALDILIRNGDSVHLTKTGLFYVIGEVKKPDAYKYIEGTTVIKAVTLAGGFTDRAAMGRIRIIRTVDKKEVVFERVSMDEPVMPEDLIVVPLSYF